MWTVTIRNISVLLCVLFSTALPAQGITIEYASSNLNKDYYQLDARVEFIFDDEVLDALEHGVNLHIDILIRLERQRKWLWDPTVKEDILSFKLERHPLSNYYLITNLASGMRQQYQSLDQALIALGSINDHTLINKDILHAESHYSGFIMAKLNVETLPPALRPVAYVSKQWQLKSPWYKWVLK